MQIDEQNKIINDFFISEVDDFLEFLKTNNILINIDDKYNFIADSESRRKSSIIKCYPYLITLNINEVAEWA